MAAEDAFEPASQSYRTYLVFIEAVSRGLGSGCGRSLLLRPKRHGNIPIEEGNRGCRICRIQLNLDGGDPKHNLLDAEAGHSSYGG